MLEKYLNFAIDLGPHEIRIVLPIPQGNIEGKDVALLYREASRFLKQFRSDNADNVQIIVHIQPRVISSAA